jgi:hypothetical protein
MTHGHRRVRPVREVNILNRHVGGKDKFVPPFDCHQRGIVANAQRHTFLES